MLMVVMMLTVRTMIAYFSFISPIPQYPIS